MKMFSSTWKWYCHSKKIVVSNRLFYYYTENPTSIMAQHKKKPNFDFIEAYEERIAFFVNSGDKDLEHCSILQLCKSLVLTYRNKMLTGEDRTRIKQLFDENWVEMNNPPYIIRLFKILFAIFHVVTSLGSQVANVSHKYSKEHSLSKKMTIILKKINCRKSEAASLPMGGAILWLTVDGNRLTVGADTTFEEMRAAL